MFYVWAFLSHDRYQYDSLILSKQTWAYPHQHLQQLLWCVVSVHLNLPEVEEWKLCPLHYYANCSSTTLTVLILHNVENVYFFYSNPVYYVRSIHNIHQDEMQQLQLGYYFATRFGRKRPSSCQLRTILRYSKNSTQSLNVNEMGIPLSTIFTVP